MRGVSKAFGRRPVLRGIDLEIGAGERVAVMGPNGSGKTTLLRMATGLVRPTRGEVRLHGLPPSDPASRRGVGVVLQDPPAYAELTPSEHIQMVAALHGRRARSGALHEAGLGSMMHHPCEGLSRGQRQRLAVATALQAGPRLLVLDEPLSALDEAGRAWATDALSAHRGTMAVAVHDLATARALDCRVVRLGGGRLHAGPTDAQATRPGAAP